MIPLYLQTREKILCTRKNCEARNEEREKENEEMNEKKKSGKGKKMNKGKEERVMGWRRVALIIAK